MLARQRAINSFSWIETNQKLQYDTPEIKWTNFEVFQAQVDTHWEVPRYLFGIRDPS